MSNEWVEESLKLAWETDYLDKLTSIYPAIPTIRKNLPEDIKKGIEESFSNGNKKELFKTILQARKQKYPFPIEHPYAALIGGLPNKIKNILINNNPILIETIGNILFKIGKEDLYKGMERPPDLNRQMGPVFRKWIINHFSSNKGYLVGNNLLDCPKDKIMFFNGEDNAIESYIHNVLKISFNEASFRRDLLVNVGGSIIVGEARFLSTSGGSQSRDINNTLNFVNFINTKKIQSFKAIAIIDGIVWFDKTYIEQMQNTNDDLPVMSALLIEKYLKKIKNKSMQDDEPI